MSPPTAILEQPLVRSRQAAALSLAFSALLTSAATPSRATIEQHEDPNIAVHGNYAAVRLPITRGIPLWNPTSIDIAPDGTVFVVNFHGEILRLVDGDGDGLEDTAVLFADVRKEGLRLPTSIALRGSEVFVGTASEIRVYEDVNKDGVADRSRTFVDSFPSTSHPYDSVYGLTFDRDGNLYFSLSTDSYNPAPAADPLGLRGALLRVQSDGSGMERIATGLRFAFGMAMNEAGDLYFSDNKGGGNPSEEINRVVPGAFYGHNPDKYSKPPSALAPIVRVQFGYGLVGIAFNPIKNDFGGTSGDLFVASWGPDFRWERGAISRIRFHREADGTVRGEEFRFAHEVPKICDLSFGPQGDLYVAQFGRESSGHLPYHKPAGGVFRIIHASWHEPPAGKPPHPLIQADASHGEKLFGSLGCSACHSVGGGIEMLGPDLKGVGDMFSEEEILHAIRNPSDGIKSGHEAVEIELADGEIVLGRVLRSNSQTVCVLQSGNTERILARSQMTTNRMLMTSLMPSGLLDSCSPSDVDDLLCYLKVRRAGAWSRWQLEVEDGFRNWRFSTSRKNKVLTILVGASTTIATVAFLAWLTFRTRRHMGRVSG